MFHIGRTALPQPLHPLTLAVLGDWPEPTGSLYKGDVRATLRVSDPGASKVDAVIWWRRRDAHPERKAVLVTDDKANPVALVAPPLVSAPCGVLSFAPNGAAVYHVYYLPYYQSGTGAQLHFHWYNCTDQHDRSCAMASLPFLPQPLLAQPQPPASSPAACTAPAAAGAARAAVVAIEGRQVSSNSGPADFHALSPMELVATPEERRPSRLTLTSAPLPSAPPSPPPSLSPRPSPSPLPSLTHAPHAQNDSAPRPTLQPSPRPATLASPCNPHSRQERATLLASSAAGNASTARVFLEPRSRAVRMFDRLPAAWARDGERTRLELNARPGEFLTFQVRARARVRATGCRARARARARVRVRRARETSSPSRWRVRGVCVACAWRVRGVCVGLHVVCARRLPPPLPLPPLPLVPPPYRWECSAWPT